MTPTPPLKPNVPLVKGGYECQFSCICKVLEKGLSSKLSETARGGAAESKMFKTLYSSSVLLLLINVVKTFVELLFCPYSASGEGNV